MKSLVGMLLAAIAAPSLLGATSAVIHEGEICAIRYQSGPMRKDWMVPVYTLAVPQCEAPSVDLYKFVNERENWGIKIAEGERAVLAKGQKIRFYAQPRRFWTNVSGALGELVMVEPDPRSNNEMGPFAILKVEFGHTVGTEVPLQKIIRGEEALPSRTEVRGLVADVAETTLILNVGKREGLKEGDVLAVEAPLREIKDPESGEVIRILTRPIGKVRLTSVDDRSSLGEFSGAESPEVGDIVKLIEKEPVRP